MGNGYTWSVHAVDRNGLSMAPSATGTFDKVLAVPTLPSNPTAGDTIPIWQWNAMPGAIAYDVHVNLPDGTTRDFNGLDTTAFTATSMTGTGIFNWQVRAQYPVQSRRYGDQLVHRPAAVHRAPCTRRPGRRPRRPAHELVFSWAPKDGAKQYTVQVSNTSTFSTNSQWTTDETKFSPDMENSTMFDNGGTLYWRVQAIDADGNHGAFTAAQAFHLPIKLFVTSSGYFQKGTKKTVTFSVKDGYGHAVAGVSVKVSGAGVVTTTKKTNDLGQGGLRAHRQVARHGVGDGLQDRVRGRHREDHRLHVVRSDRRPAAVVYAAGRWADRFVTRAASGHSRHAITSTISTRNASGSRKPTATMVPATTSAAACRPRRKAAPMVLGLPGGALTWPRSRISTVMVDSAVWSAR